MEGAVYFNILADTPSDPVDLVVSRELSERVLFPPNTAYLRGSLVDPAGCNRTQWHIGWRVVKIAIELLVEDVCFV